MSTDSKIVFLKTADLHFDATNPRLADYSSNVTTEPEILKILWDVMDVQEVMQSIAASGFFPYEALVVAKEGGKYVVIEGNRRLAAVKALLSPQVAKENGWQVPQIPRAIKETLVDLPVIISTREESWRYLGFKHVNGPAKWSSYAKAVYIAEVHETYGITLDEIAQQIGDRHNTVQRLFRGLMVLVQAEKAKVYDREDRFRQKLAFSHLYTGLDYDGISKFLHIAPKEKETSTPVPTSRLAELGELLVWLYGSKKANKAPVVQTQNPDLRQLNAAVENRQAVAALRSDVELSRAYEISRPPVAVFEEALLAAKRELTTARAYLTVGYDSSEAILRIAGTIADIADDIYKEMERKSKPSAKKSRLSEL